MAKRKVDGLGCIHLGGKRWFTDFPAGTVLEIVAGDRPQVLLPSGKLITLAEEEHRYQSLGQ